LKKNIIFLEKMNNIEERRIQARKIFKVYNPVLIFVENTQVKGHTFDFYNENLRLGIDLIESFPDRELSDFIVDKYHEKCRNCEEVGITYAAFSEYSNYFAPFTYSNLNDVAKFIKIV